jgi:hypothetical protein
MGVGGAPLPNGRPRSRAERSSCTVGDLGQGHQRPRPLASSLSSGFELGAEVAPLALCSPGVMQPGGDDELVEFRMVAARSSHNHGIGLLRWPRGRPWRSMAATPPAPPLALLLSLPLEAASWRWSGGEKRPENNQENSRGRENARVWEMRGLECPVLDSKGENRTRQNMRG